jgi:hypothetical protein
MRKGSDMTTTKTETMPAIERYRLAVIEFRRAYAQLAAADRRANRQGFGTVPDIVLFRHALANPDESGSLGDDVAKILG